MSGALEHFPPFLISVVRFLGFGGLGFALLFIFYLYLTATCAGEVSVDSSAVHLAAARALALVLQQNYTKSDLWYASDSCESVSPLLFSVEGGAEGDEDWCKNNQSPFVQKEKKVSQ